jgi:hypothetical protein
MRAFCPLPHELTDHKVWITIIIRESTPDAFFLNMVMWSKIVGDFLRTLDFCSSNLSFHVLNELLNINGMRIINISVT